MPMLKQIAEAPMESTTDYLGLWSGIYAQQLLRAGRDFDLKLAARETNTTENLQKIGNRIRL